MVWLFASSTISSAVLGDALSSDPVRVPMASVFGSVDWLFSVSVSFDEADSGSEPGRLHISI